MLKSFTSKGNNVAIGHEVRKVTNHRASNSNRENGAGDIMTSGGAKNDNRTESRRLHTNEYK